MRTDKENKTSQNMSRGWKEATHKWENRDGCTMWGDIFSVISYEKL